MAKPVYHKLMRRLARPIAVILSLVLLQLVLVESGYACRGPAAGPASDMAGMQMPGNTEHSPSAPTQQDQQDGSCRFPWAPTGCQAMAPCAPSALTVATANVASAPSERNALEPLIMLAPPAVNSAPELPPPRA